MALRYAGALDPIYPTPPQGIISDRTQLSSARSGGRRATLLCGEPLERLRDLPVEALVLPQVIQRKRGLPISVVVLVLAALRDAPFPAQVLFTSGRYFVRMGPPGQESYLDTGRGKVLTALDPGEETRFHWE